MIYIIQQRKFLIIILVMLSFNSFGQEICNNAIDDDADGLIDLNDFLDCSCSLITPTLIPSLISNPSFEIKSNCPTHWSQLSFATNWIQPTLGTSDYYNCNYSNGAAQAAGLLPYPDGTGIAGEIITYDYKEYIATCLTLPLIAGNEYILKFNIASTPLNSVSGNMCNEGNVFYPPVDITIFGNSNCNAISTLTTTFNCPINADPTWVALGSVNYTPTPNWSIATISFTPNATINAITIGAPCNASNYPAGLVVTTNGYCTPYFYYDNFILNQKSEFGLINIVPSGHYCSNNIILSAVVSTSTSSSAIVQWYHNGIAIIGATNFTYSVAVGSAGLGSYEVRLTDGVLCAQSTKYLVTTNPPTISINNPYTCLNTPVTITANGFCSSYLWSTSAITNSIVVNPTSTTHYTVIGSLGSCTTQVTNTVTVLVPYMSITGNTIICSGQSTTLTANGSTSIYVWDEPTNSQTLNYFNVKQPTATPSITTTYTVTDIDNDFGCQSKAVITISVIPHPTITITPSISVICLGESIKMTANILGTNTYTWSNGAHTSSIITTPITNTTYTVSTSNVSCVANTTATIFVLTPPIANFSGIWDTILPLNTMLELINTSIGAINYQWNYCTNSVSSNTNISFTLTENGLCCITLTAYSNTCKDTLTTCVKVYSEGTVTVPNVFTPNNDNVNDFFYIKGYGLKKMDCLIFDRWGLKIHELNKLSDFWDGKTKIGNAPSGTYFYIINYIDVFNKSNIQKGFLTLFRD